MNGFRFFFRTWAPCPIESRALYARVIDIFHPIQEFQFNSIEPLMGFCDSHWANFSNSLKFHSISLEVDELHKCQHLIYDSRISIFVCFFSLLFRFGFVKISHFCRVQLCDAGRAIQVNVKNALRIDDIGHCWPMFCTALVAAMFHFEHIINKWLIYCLIYHGRNRKCFQFKRFWFGSKIRIKLFSTVVCVCVFNDKMFVSGFVADSYWRSY